MQAADRASTNIDSSLEKLQQRLSWLRRDPGNASLYRQCADSAAALRRYDVLFEIVEQALSHDPDNAALGFDRANALIGLHDYRQALATLATLQPASTEQQSAISVNRAVCHYCLGEYAEALPLLMSEYRLGRRHPELLFMLIRSCHHAGQLEEAVAIANADADAGDRDAALAGAYALMFLDASDAGAAARWSAIALRLDPRSIDGAVTDGTLAIMRLQTERAHRRFKDTIEMAPETGRAWLGLGMLAMLQNDLPQARSHFEHGLQFTPTYVGGWHMLGWTQLMQQDLDAAEQSLNRAMTLDRNFAETHGALATLEAMRGNVELAQQRLAIAQRLDRDCFSAELATALLNDPTLREGSSREFLQTFLAKIAGQNDSALGRLLLQRPRH